MGLSKRMTVRNAAKFAVYDVMMMNLETTIELFIAIWVKMEIFTQIATRLLPIIFQTKLFRRKIYRFSLPNNRKNEPIYIHFGILLAPCGVNDIKQNHRQSLILILNSDFPFWSVEVVFELFLKLYGLQRSIIHIKVLQRVS